MLENKLLLQDPGKALNELVTAQPVEGAEQLSLVLFGEVILFHEEVQKSIQSWCEAARAVHVQVH